MKRKPASFRLKPVTIQTIKDLADSQNTTQGRIIDNFVTNHKEGVKNENKTNNK